MTTRESRRSDRPEAEVDRERAWAHMLETPGGVRRKDPLGLTDEKRLGEVARQYDQVCRRAQGRLRPEASETDVLAALLVLGTLRDKLVDDELMLITLARSYGVTWTRIADALGMKSRQSAERRHLQLSHSTRADGTRPHTQNERVEHTRERRRRRAERTRALANAGTIHTAALALTAIPDLQERANRSREATLMAAPVNQDSVNQGPVDMNWPSALKECLAEYLRFRADPRAHLSPDHLAPGDEEWQLQRQQADILHRMLGLLRYAADPRHLDLSDHPDLLERVANLDYDPAIRTRS
ncbi:hypothetical protein ACIRD6_33055 [Streptomyces sp. NPDC102473]|uniref:hypothetical protein n=1 Tax=Streptomyces sp. NPDC102473 TaxID=3366180 RepID=UPI0037FEC11E